MSALTYQSTGLRGGTPEGAFAALSASGARWCVLRAETVDNDALHNEIDVLVADSDHAIAAEALCRAGFVRRATRGRGSHTFYTALDRASGRWTTFDVVTRIDFGRWQQLPSRLAEDILEHCSGDEPRVPAPQDAFWLLALHCLLDVGHADPKHQATLLRVLPAALDAPVAPAVSDVVGHDVCARLLDAVAEGAWSLLPELAAQVTKAHSRARRLTVGTRARRNRAARSRYRRYARRQRGVTVAVLGPDGAGKSTLMPLLMAAWPWPASTRYMGLYPMAEKRPPKWTVGLGFGRRVVRLAGAHLEAKRLARKGHLVVLDRFPWDVLLPGPSHRRRRVQRAVFGSWPAPDVLVVLDAPGALLFDRKGEGDPASLETARQAYLELAEATKRRGRSEVVVVDATKPPSRVQGEVTAAVWRLVATRMAKGMGGQPCES